MKRSLLWNALCCLALVACDCGPDVAPGEACLVNPDKPGCGRTCDEDESCPIGLYCDNMMCTADCDPQNSCGEGYRCDIQKGVCIELTPPDGSTVDINTEQASCADINVDANPVIPTVVLLIDQSGSMDEDFDGTTRWQAVKDAVLPDGAIVGELQGSVRFGLTMYSAVSDDSNRRPEGECPRLTSIDPALDNLENIRSTFGPADSLDETPTGDSIRAITPSLAAMGDEPKILIIATDGEPDSCMDTNPRTEDERNLARDASVQAVRDAYTAGIRSYILSVGQGNISRDHLQDMANAGLNTNNAMFWEAGNDDGLKDALRTIIGGEVSSCELVLNGRIDDLTAACSGTVVLNGNVLPCDDPDGWKATDGNHIEIMGEACEELLEGDAELKASFPCGVVLI